MNNLNFGLKQKNYMRHEYAKIWTKMRKNIYAYNSYDKFLFKLIKKKINLKKKKILEICCGDGNPFASKLISEKYFYKGIDISGFLINLAKKNYGDKYFDIGDAENLKFKNSMFELVFCIHSFWYISNINKSINEMTRVLKPKGYLIFDTLNSLNTQIIQDHEKVIFESKGFGKFLRYFKNLIKIISFTGYTKWSDVIHQKPNDIKKIVNLLKKNTKLKNLIIFGQQELNNKIYKLNPKKNLNFKKFKKIIFQCQKI